MSCAQCHTVPVGVGDPGHIDGDNKAEINFDALNPIATYTAANQTCGNLYCHGNGWSTLGTMRFTDQASLGCNSCHASNLQGADSMSGEHKTHLEENISCNGCHSGVVNGAGTIINANLHVDGQRSIDMLTGGTWDPAQRRCTNLACHENERW